MTDIFLGAIVSLLFLGLGKIYNRIDEIGKSLASRNNNKILASFNKIEESLDTIKNKILTQPQTPESNHSIFTLSIDVWACF